MKRDNFDWKVPVAGPFFFLLFFYASCACALRFHHIKSALQFFFFRANGVTPSPTVSPISCEARSRPFFWLVAFFFFFLSALLGMKSCNPQWRFFLFVFLFGGVVLQIEKLSSLLHCILALLLLPLNPVLSVFS